MCVFSVYSTLFNLIPIFALPKYLVVVFYPCIFLWLSINPPNCQRLMFSPTYNRTYLCIDFHLSFSLFRYSNFSLLTLECFSALLISTNVATFLIIAYPFLIVTTAISMQPLFRFLTLTENNKPNNRYTI